MSVYLMAGLNIHNPGPYEEYVRRTQASVEKYKVEVLAVCDTPVAPEGRSPFDRYVLLKFADRAAFDAWYHSPEYQAAIPIRHAEAATGFLVMVDGLS